MLKLKRQSALAIMACVLFTLCAGRPARGAQNHVVSPAEIQKDAVAASHVRQQNVDTVTQFLSSPRAQQVLQSARVNPDQVKHAVSSLSDEEVARLASRVDKAQSDFAAGRMSDRDLMWIILAILALVLIIVAVH